MGHRVEALGGKYQIDIESDVVKSYIRCLMDLIKEDCFVDTADMILIADLRHLCAHYFDLFLVNPLHQFFIGESIGNDVGNINDWHLIFIGEEFQVIFSRHRSVIFDNFTDDAGRSQPCQPAKIHRAFCMPGTHQHPTLFGNQWKDVTRTHEILRSRKRICQFSDAIIPLCRRNTSRCRG